MIFRKLERTWGHNDANYIPRFKETFPELKKVSSEELCNRFIAIGLDFYTDKKVEVSGLIRLTLPFALILFVLMFIGLPFAFMITGKWGYGDGKNSRILNWFRALNLQ